MAYPTTKDTFQRAAALISASSLGAIPLAALLEKMGITLEGLQDRAGTDALVDEAALVYRLARQEAVTELNVERYGIMPGAGLGAVNTFAIQTLLASILPTEPVDLIFPAQWGSYEFLGIDVADRQSVRLLGMGQEWTELVCTGTGGSANPFIKMHGTDTADFSGRVRYSGVGRMKLRNASAADTNGLHLLHQTHCHYEDIFLEGWRRHGIYGSNVSDSWFDRIELEFCGSVNDADLAAVHWDGAASAYWSGDANKWNACRWEVCGDRQVHLGAGCNKFVFTGCKFENSGSDSNGLGGTDTQFEIGSSTHVVLQGCDFTMQDKRSGHALIPSCIKVEGEGALYMSDVQFSFGSGSRPKVFTAFVEVNGGNTTAVLSNVCGNSGNTTAFPTNFVKAVGTPILGLKNVGWIGSNRGSGPTVLTGAVSSLAF